MCRACSWAIVLVISAVSVAFALAEEAPVVIPLKEIWAEDMPGTRNVRELEKVPPKLSNEELFRHSLVEQVKLPLRKGLPKAAGNGFAVAGTGLEALRGARDVLTNNKHRPGKLPRDDELSLIFYSYSVGTYVHLVSVDREKHVFTIKWRFVSHATLEATAHFALIPAGRLEPGTYNVNVVQLPLRTGDRAARSRAIEKSLVERIVCQPFSFEIK